MGALRSLHISHGLVRGSLGEWNGRPCKDFDRRMAEASRDLKRVEREMGDGKEMGGAQVRLEKARERQKGFWRVRYRSN